MTEAQHTPGPWEWQTPMGEHCPWIVKGGREAYEWEAIATLGDCIEDGPSPRSKAFKEVQANARLIAAAPDLLSLAHQYRNDLLYPPAADSRERRIAAIDAAIVKATVAA